MRARWLPCLLIASACSGAGAASRPPPHAQTIIVILPREGPALQVVEGSSLTPTPPPHVEVNSYEAAVAAIASADDSPPPSGPDLTNQQLSAPMMNAVWLKTCGVPDSTKVTVRVAIRRGAPVGVSIYSNPKDDALERCVKDHVASLRWPESPKTDFFTTTY